MPKTTPSEKMNLYFITEIRYCLGLFGTPTAQKTCSSYICNDGVQFHMKIRNISLRRPSSVDDAELGHLGTVYMEGGCPG